MIYNIIQELNYDRSRLHKEAVLRREADNHLLKRVFEYALDPFRNFFIRKIPKYKPAVNVTAAHLGWALDELDRLSSRELTGNAGIDHLKMILESLDVDDAKVVELIIAKDMKCGVSEATVNKIWPGLVKVYPCMLASGFDRKLFDKMKFPVIVQQKLDGLRFNAIVKDGLVEYRSRSGREIFLHGELEQEFLKLADGKNVVFDGELIFMDPDWYQYLDRKTSNGLGTKAIKGTISMKEASYACVELWDAIPLDNFNNGFYGVPYAERFDDLTNSILELKQTPTRIRVAQTGFAFSYEEIQELYAAHRALGHEGVIVKDQNLTWESKRVEKQVKIKSEQTAELRVVGIQPGTGKYAGMLGALICESEDGIVKVDVGSGFKDEERKLTDWVGKIVSVKYNERITNKAGDQSLFLPIFEEVRIDKTRADSSSEIK